jgi:hypothetical protein
MPIAQHSRKNRRENGVIAYGVDQKYPESSEIQANSEKNGSMKGTSGIVFKLSNGKHFIHGLQSNNRDLIIRADLHRIAEFYRISENL